MMKELRKRKLDKNKSKVPLYIGKMKTPTKRKNIEWKNKSKEANGEVSKRMEKYRKGIEGSSGD